MRAFTICACFIVSATLVVFAAKILPFRGLPIVWIVAIGLVFLAFLLLWFGWLTYTGKGKGKPKKLE